jgi:mannitol/fructose-specific phosphotransferase system IIA component (Ntr-type)
VLGQIASFVDDDVTRDKLLRANSAAAMLEIIEETIGKTHSRSGK